MPYQAVVFWTQGMRKMQEKFPPTEWIGVAIKQANAKMYYLRTKYPRMKPHANILKDGLLHQIIA